MRERMEPLICSIPRTLFPRCAALLQLSGIPGRWRTCTPSKDIYIPPLSAQSRSRYVLPASRSGPMGPELNPAINTRRRLFSTKTVVSPDVVERPSISATCPAMASRRNTTLTSPAVVGHPSVLTMCRSAPHVTGASPPQHARPGVADLVSQQPMTSMCPMPGYTWNPNWVGVPVIVFVQEYVENSSDESRSQKPPPLPPS